ncbi:MAG: hypothetical protein KY461_08560 [Actinobacteria bacterium]|nr:hypothetical protein [Actinomycetota bacterium]
MLRRAVLSVSVVVGLVAAAPVPAEPSDPLEPVTDAVAGAAGACDPTDVADCLLPFPNDRFTVADDTTATGLRIDLSPLAMPRNVAGKPIDPTEWNRNDGFSPGSMMLTHVPGLDLAQTWRHVLTDLGAEPGRPILEVPSASLHDDAPIVLVNAETGERHPFWAELDQHPGTPPEDALLIVRPLVNLEEATRYVIGLRDLRGADGTELTPGDAFRAIRDDDADDRYERIFADLAAHADREELYLAWDFTVASAENLAGRALHIRDDAFAGLGDEVLDDLEVAGAAPTITIDYVDTADGNSDRVVHGAVTVPNYLVLPQERVDLGRHHRDGYDVPAVMVPGSRFFYPPGSELPAVNPAAPTMEIPFACAVPTTAVDEDGRVAEPAMPILYGHGLLGQRIEGAYWSGGRHMLVNHNAMNCGVDWIGMAQEDLANVASILGDVSNFASLADRAQQGFLGFLMVGRAMIHPDGFASLPQFQDVEGRPLIDTDELFYDGNSQGGIMGGALTALAPDFTKAVLGVPAMNYSTLLNRSVDWEGAYGEVYYNTYRDPQERQLGFALIQMLWDRAEGNGYAHHMTDDPYPNTPAHQVLLHVAYGDFQVANVAAEVQARTVGAALLPTALADGRHWSVDPAFGLETFAGTLARGSALIYFDSGNAVPPSANLPPGHVGSDPHGHPRGDTLGGVQKERFLRQGLVFDTRHGEPYYTSQCDDEGQPVPCPAPNDAD